jgi:hypothetical protein
VANQVDQLLKRAESADLSELMSIWRSRLPEKDRENSLGSGVTAYSIAAISKTDLR